jgi:opacity protein-like surface antigen
MGRFKAFMLAGALAMPLTAGAYAADFPGARPTPLIVENTRPIFESLDTGWYVRGDLGYRFGRIGSANSAPGFPDPVDNKLGNTIDGALGVGIKSGWFRSDITADFAGAQKYRGTIATPEDVTAKIRSDSVLFNLYLDLGSWYGLTPYLGAGAGESYVRTSDYNSAVAPPFTAGNGHSQWKATYAGMAGVAWQVAPRTMIDFGYRYLNFGSVMTDSDNFGAMTFRNVAAHEVRIGVRWSFDDIRRVQ